MFCTQCGNEEESHARFCSKCGSEISAQPKTTVQPPETPPAQRKTVQHDMDMHINILGWLLIGSGILTGILAMMILFAGQVLHRLPIPFPPEVRPGMPLLITWVATMVGLGTAALAAGVAGAGVGLLQYRSWARVLAIIMAVLLVFHFPIGTVIAVYAFWVLFSREGQEYYKTRSESTMTTSGT
jgi:hypothetical protein